MYAVDNEMHVRVLGVVMRDKQDLMAFPLHVLQEGMAGLDHFLSGRSFLAGPCQRNGHHRPLKGPPVDTVARLHLEEELVEGGHAHFGENGLGLVLKGVNGVGPGDTVLGLPDLLALGPLVVQVVESRALETCAGLDAGDHGSRACRTYARMSSSSMVSSRGGGVRRSFMRWAIWLRLVPMRRSWSIKRRVA